MEIKALWDFYTIPWQIIYLLWLTAEILRLTISALFIFSHKTTTNPSVRKICHLYLCQVKVLLVNYFLKGNSLKWARIFGWNTDPKSLVFLGGDDTDIPPPLIRLPAPCSHYHKSAQFSDGVLFINQTPLLWHILCWYKTQRDLQTTSVLTWLGVAIVSGHSWSFFYMPIYSYLKLKMHGVAWCLAFS